MCIVYINKRGSIMAYQGIKNRFAHMKLWQTAFPDSSTMKWLCTRICCRSQHKTTDIAASHQVLKLLAFCNKLSAKPNQKIADVSI